MGYNSKVGDLIFEIFDSDMKSTAVKNFGTNKTLFLTYRLCVMGKFVIVYYKDNLRKYLVKFDQDLVEIKRTELKYELWYLEASEKLIYGFKRDVNCQIHVFNDEFYVLYRLGQSDRPESPFYLTNNIFSFLICNKKFHFIYNDRIDLVDQETGNIIKVIDINAEIIDLDSSGNLYILERERSMMVVFDFNGDLLDEIPLINLPKCINFFIDNEKNTRFIVNDNKISDLFKIIPDFF